MKTSIIIVGLVLLVISGLLYFVPMQQFSADTTTTDGSNIDTRTSSASVNIPVGWAYAIGIIGLILLVSGFIIPTSNKQRNSKKNSFNKVTESKEDVELGNGNNKKVTRERTESHISKRN